MLYALRLLLDRGFTDYDLELKDSDYDAYEDTDELKSKPSLKILRRIVSGLE